MPRSVHNASIPATACRFPCRLQVYCGRCPHAGASSADAFAGQGERAAAGCRNTRRFDMNVTPYLCYEGRCEEALQFYRDRLDAKIDALMRFSEAPESSADSSGCGEMPSTVTGDKVMHAS